VDTHSEGLLYVYPPYVHRYNSNARSLEANFCVTIRRYVTCWPLLQKWFQPSAHFGGGIAVPHTDCLTFQFFRHGIHFFLLIFHLVVQDRYVRAWPGGTGDCKVGGNYAPTIAPQEEAAQRGFNQVLWLFGEDQEVTEVGTMNLFFYMRGEDGVNELVTAPLNDIVLPGVTRDSIIHLARQHNIRVSERRQTMKQLIAAMDAGRVLEAFGAGTACVVSPVKEINFKGTAYSIPLGKEQDSKSGPMAQFFWDELTKIQVRFLCLSKTSVSELLLF
jgi:hypothetical protein